MPAAYACIKPPAVFAYRADVIQAPKFVNRKNNTDEVTIANAVFVIVALFCNRKPIITVKAKPA